MLSTMQPHSGKSWSDMSCPYRLIDTYTLVRFSQVNNGRDRETQVFLIALWLLWQLELDKKLSLLISTKILQRTQSNSVEVYIYIYMSLQDCQVRRHAHLLLLVALCC